MLVWAEKKNTKFPKKNYAVFSSWTKKNRFSCIFPWGLHTHTLGANYIYLSRTGTKMLKYVNNKSLTFRFCNDISRSVFGRVFYFIFYFSKTQLKYFLFSSCLDYFVDLCSRKHFQFMLCSCNIMPFEKKSKQMAFLHWKMFSSSAMC